MELTEEQAKQIEEAVVRLWNQLVEEVRRIARAIAKWWNESFLPNLRKAYAGAGKPYGDDDEAMFLWLKYLGELSEEQWQAELQGLSP